MPVKTFDLWLCRDSQAGSSYRLVFGEPTWVENTYQGSPRGNGYWNIDYDKGGYALANFCQDGWERRNADLLLRVRQKIRIPAIALNEAVTEPMPAPKPKKAKKQPVKAAAKKPKKAAPKKAARRR